MPLLDKLKNLFSSGGDNRKKLKQQPSYKKKDVDPSELWDILGELGDGAFGKVFKAEHKVKKIEAALKQVEINNEAELEEFSVEVEILCMCKHENLIGLYEAYFFDNKLWMYIEFCGGGALDRIMMDLEKPLTEPQIQYICKQMCKAIDFLHQNFVIHRDLKAGNVLLTSDGQVKLADFGVSAKNSSIRQTRDTFIGTPYWMAPEVILCETIKDSPYTFKADIWSFGITLIEFAEIQPPNHEMHPMRVLIKIQKSSAPTLRRPTNWSSQFKDFIAKCLVKDPDGRPTAGDLIEHPFIKDVDNNEPIVILLSEVKAEVFLEEKDIDDVMDDVLSVVIHDDDADSSDVQPDVDSVSLSASETDASASPNVYQEFVMTEIVTPEAPIQDNSSSEHLRKTEPGGNVIDIAASGIRAQESEMQLGKEEVDSSDTGIQVLDTAHIPGTEVAVTSVPVVKEKMPYVPLSKEMSGAPAVGLLVEEEQVSSMPLISELASDMHFCKQQTPNVPVNAEQDKDSSTAQLAGVPVLKEEVSDVPPSREKDLTSQLPVLREYMLDVSVAREHMSDVPVTREHVSSVPEMQEQLSDLHSTTELVSDVHVSREHASDIPVAREHVSGVPEIQEQLSDLRTTTELVSDVSVLRSHELGIPIAREHVSGVPEIQEQLSDLHSTTELVSDVSVLSSHESGIPVARQHVSGVPEIQEQLSDLHSTTELVSDVPGEGVPLTGQQLTGISVTDYIIKNGKQESDMSVEVERDPSKLVTNEQELITHVTEDSLTEVTLEKELVADISNSRKLMSEENLPCIKEETLDRGDNENVTEYLESKTVQLYIKDENAKNSKIDVNRNEEAELTVVSVQNKSDDTCKISSEETKSVQLTGEKAFESNRGRQSTENDVGNSEAATSVNVVLMDGLKPANTMQNSSTNSLNQETSLSGSAGDHNHNSNIENSVKAIAANGTTAKVNVEITNDTDDEATEKKNETKGKVVRYKPHKSKAPAMNAIPCGGGGGEGGVVAAESLTAVDASAATTVGHGSAAATTAIVEKQKVTDQEDQRKQFRTLTKTRKFMVNGVVMTSQTSRVVLSGTENKKQQDHQLWKADLRELKRLQKEENRLLQMADTKAKTALDELSKKQEMDMQLLLRSVELELDQLSKKQQKQRDKLVSSQSSEYRCLQKKVKIERERDVKSLRESLKQDMKLWKQGIEMLPKPLRKEAQAKKKEEKDIEQAQKERIFMEQQHDKAEKTMKRLIDQHREKMALLDVQFLQQKHQMLEVRESKIAQLEERHMQEKRQLSELQLKNKFILKRQLMMQRNAKEMEQMKRINVERLQVLNQRHALELRRLPKILKSDAKTRHLMYKESLRISFIGVTPEQEKEKIKEFEEKEKKRRQQEIHRLENKHKRQLDDLNNKNDMQLQELEELHVEKQKLLLHHEEQKMNELQKNYEAEVENWKAQLEPRKQNLLEECNKELAEHEHFYSQVPGPMYRVSSAQSLTGSVKSGSSVRSSLVM